MTKARDLADLVSLYGVNDEAERDNMHALSRHGCAPGWWQAYGDAVPAWMVKTRSLSGPATEAPERTAYFFAARVAFGSSPCCSAA